MSRIAATFQRTKGQGTAAFVAYLAAGDPDFATSLDLCRATVRSGADILELGVPFSDPLADGLTNQLAAERALRSGMTPAKTLELAKALRADFPDLPIVLYTYYNLLFANGLAATLAETAAAGVDAILALDLPPEEADDYLRGCAANGLQTVFIVAPTTPAARIQRIANATTGFIYYVSQEGVTGERADVASDLQPRIDAIRNATALPVVVGFGISQPHHVKAVAAVADGVVVGSALVNCIARNPNQPDTARAELSNKVSALCAALS